MLDSLLRPSASDCAQAACLSGPLLIYLCSRAVGHRFGRHLDVAVPLAISYCDDAGENEEELQEYCLQVRMAV